MGHGKFVPFRLPGQENELDLGGDMGGGDWGGDLDLGDLGGLPEEPVHVEDRGLNLTLGDSCQTKWLKKRRLPCDLVAAGDFEEALNLLKRRLGLINAEPLEAIFKEAYWATCSALPALPQMPSLHWPLLSEGSAKARDLAPKILFTPQVACHGRDGKHSSPFQRDFRYRRKHKKKHVPRILGIGGE